MINGVNNSAIQTLNKTVSGSGADSASGIGSTSGPSFADMLKDSIGEVSRLQEDATKAVQDLTTGKNENVTGVMTAVEKSDLAFKTLLAIRTKLLDAYEEIKNIPI